VNQAHQLRETHRDADVATLIRAYRKSIEDSPENLLLRAELADLHLRYGLLEDAVVQYRQILKRNPQSLGLHHRLISAHLWNDDYDDAAATLMELANLHVERGEQLDALEALQSILSLEPHHFQARRAMVERFTALQDSKLVAYHLRQLAESALTKGNLDEAIPAFKQLMEISDDPSLEDRLAQVYESQGDNALALQHYGRLAQRYRSEGRIEEAAAVTERIVGLAPDDLSIRGDLLELYSKLGMSDKVLTQRYQLACFYHSQGKAREAMSLLEQVLQE
jgi:tetratricopeptide (TPR) repeat protein